MSSSTKDVKIAPGSVICLEAKLKGKFSISIGSLTVIHPKASVIAEAGPIVIGENNIIEEQASIIHSRIEDDVANVPIPLSIGVNNVFEVGCEVRAKSIGDHNVFEPKCYVGPDVEIGNGCIIGAGCRLTAQERLPDQTVITGQLCTRRVAVDKPPGSDDVDRQSDELMVMKEIFTKEEFNECSYGNESYIVFDAQPTIPGTFTLMLTKSDGRQTKFNVNYLPPIRLMVRLLPDYPSQRAPEFTLRCTWLSKDRLAELVEELDRLWNENKCEILFIWCSFLKDQSLEFLNIVDAYELCERCPVNCHEEIQNGKAERCQGNVQIPSKSGAISDSWFHNAPSELSKSHHHSSRRPSNRVSFAVRGKAFNENQFLLKGQASLVRKALGLLESYRENALDDLYFNMVGHNADKTKEEFNRVFQDCNVCFCSVLGEYCKKLSCGHVTCVDCLSRMFDVHIKHGTMESIVCSEENCGYEIPPSLIKELVSNEIFEKYDQLMLNRTLDKITNMTYCPRMTCQYPVSVQENGDSLAICPNCKNAFCIFCKRAYHGIEGCKMNTDEKRELIDLYQNGNYEKKLELEKRYGKKQLADLVNAAQSEMWMSENSKKCPCCHVNIEKSDGCNKMVCQKCNANFCWVCQTRLSSLNPYLHYQDPKSKCFNLLFQGVYDRVDDDNNELLSDPEDIPEDLEEVYFD